MSKPTVELPNDNETQIDDEFAMHLPRVDDLGIL